MNFNSIILFAAAILPAIALGIFVFKKDRVEKEPVPLLLKLFFFGVLSCVPVILVSSPLCDFIDSLFAGSITIEGDVIYYDSTATLWTYTAAKYFIGVALVEELGKFAFLYFATKNNKNFNSLFDGIIYSVFVSLGFAALENVLYVFNGGLQVALLRAFLSVPGHMFFGVLMGYYYSLWHVTEKAKLWEKKFKDEGVIPQHRSISSKGHMTMCLLMPILAHGAYDFCCSIGSGLMTLVFIILEVFLYVHCFGKINKISKADGYTNNYAILMFIKEYPETAGYFMTDNH